MRVKVSDYVYNVCILNKNSETNFNTFLDIHFSRFEIVLETKKINFVELYYIVCMWDSATY